MYINLTESTQGMQMYLLSGGREVPGAKFLAWQSPHHVDSKGLAYLPLPNDLRKLVITALIVLESSCKIRTIYQYQNLWLNLPASRQEIDFPESRSPDDPLSRLSVPGETLLSDGLSSARAGRPGSGLTLIEATPEAVRLLFPSKQKGK